jgi:1,4-dihydroxy-6-naphthoate synthase
MKIRLGISHEADDAFMFHALLTGKVDSAGLDIQPVVDVFPILNDQASRGQLEATVMSLHAYVYSRRRYRLARCGATFGRTLGPALIAREPMAVDDLLGATVAVPGVTSSAYLMLTIWNPTVRTRVVPFDKVIPAIETGLADVGLVTPEEKPGLDVTGLATVMDLSVWWSGETDGLPLPLGCFAIRRDLPDQVQTTLQKVVADSIQYAMDNKAEVLAAIHADTPDVDLAAQQEFVEDYVSPLSVDLGDEGVEAMTAFLARGAQAGLIETVDLTFID